MSAATTKPAKSRTEDRPTGRTARCPVCDSDLETVRRHTIAAGDGHTMAADDHDRFPTHPVPGHGHDCCESLDPVYDADYRRARRPT